MKTTLYKKFTTDFENTFGANYKGETDIKKVLDLRSLKDDIDGLIEQMEIQPAVYAYWANFRRTAEDKYSELSIGMEIYKAGKVKEITQKLIQAGVKVPTAKMVDASFRREFKDDEFYKKKLATLEMWRKRKEQLVIMEKAVQSREQQFRSLSYLMSSMMNAGLMTRKKLNPKTHKIKE